MTEKEKKAGKVAWIITTIYYWQRQRGCDIFLIGI
jgi:hypothetical protein